MASEFNIVRGTSETLTCYITAESGAIVDLTGYTAASLYADKALNATSPTLTKTASSVLPTLGFVRFVFAPADTASLATGEYFAEVHITINSGAEYRTIQPFIFRIHQRVKL